MDAWLALLLLVALGLSGLPGDLPAATEQ